MVQVRHVCLGLVALLSVMASPVSAVHLEGRVVRVGFPGSSTQRVKGQDYYRSDTWIPILIELNNKDGDRFTGRVEVRQNDRDGDEAAASWPVNLRNDMRRFHLYVPAGQTQGSFARDNTKLFHIRVYDEEGSLAPLFDDTGTSIPYLNATARDLEPVSTNANVVLDISTKPVNALGDLINDTQLVQPVVVTRISPNSLPDSAAGLAMADIIVWDGGDPADFIDPSQRDALVEWIRQGGTLVVSVNRNLNQLKASSTLAKLLPGIPTGTQPLNQPTPAIAKALMGAEGAKYDLLHPLTVCTLRKKQLANDAIAVMPDNPDEDELILVARRPMGLGHVVLVTAELGDLLSIGETDVDFLKEALVLRSHAITETNSTVYASHDLFTVAEGLIGFSTDSVLYFLFAFAFVIGYILLATGGVWVGLKRRGMIHHTWTAFALVALVTSGLSLLAVRVVRGIGSRVQEVSVIDMSAGSTEAQGLCYFGLKTASHVRHDLKLPNDPNSPEDSVGLQGGLMSMPVDIDNYLTTHKMYSASLRYDALASVGELHNVPFRATLKKIKGQWRGQLDGQVNGNLRRIAGGQLSGDSWIENQLGTELTEGHLILAGLDTGSRIVPRARIYPIPTLKHNQRISIQDVISKLTKEKLSKKEQGAGQVWRPDAMDATITSWLNNVGFRSNDNSYQYGEENTKRKRVDESSAVSALKLLCMYDEIDPDVLADRGISRPLGHELDCTTRLARHWALFIAISHEPGPARLCGKVSGRDSDEWEPFKVSRSLVMYRVWIPVD